MRLPLLILHISAGILGILSGFAALFFRKRSRGHGLVGNVFFISMLSMSASATWLVFMKSQTGNVLGGIFAFYLMATAWVTARRNDKDIEVRAKRASIFCDSPPALNIRTGLTRKVKPICTNAQ